MKTVKKKIGIISANNPMIDKKAHSGILYRINESIENASFETVWIENKESRLYKIISKLCTGINIFFKKNIYFDRTTIGSYLLYRTLNKSLINYVDYIMVVHYFHIPYWLKTNKPIIYHSDATFSIVDNYYLHNLWEWNKKQAEHIEKITLQKSTYHLSSSNWRDNSVKNHYNIKTNNCFVLEYGPCMNIVNFKRESYINRPLYLLFISVEWERKGGEVAVEICNELNKKGVKTILHIVGIKQKPDSCKDNPNINFVGYLNKNDKHQYDDLIDIMKNTDIMVLPTKAECSAIVFSENSAYGIPIITYDTGGIANYVINGLNGYRLPMTFKAIDFADKIHNIVTNSEINKLSEGGRHMFRERLNWNNWTNWFHQLNRDNI